MGYLICQNCGGYYKLKEGESPEDFVACECYGPLVYVENLDVGLGIRKTNEVKSDALKELKKRSSEKKSVVEMELSHKKEPTVKNRAYYRRFYYYSEPNITELKQNKDVTGLVNALYYDDPRIRQEAAQALAAVGDERALEHLDKVIKEEKGSLKLYAEIAVNQIKSKKHGFKSQNRDNYRNISHESINITPKVSQQAQETDLIKVKEERKTKPLRVSSPDEATDLKKSVKYSFAKEEASSKIHEDHPLPSTGSKELKKKGLKREELKREELKKEELKGSKDSETSGDISDPLMVKDSQVKKSDTKSPQVLESNVKLDEVETIPEIESESPSREVEKTGISKVKTEKTEPSNVKVEETKLSPLPELKPGKVTPTGIESSEVEVSEVKPEEITSTVNKSSEVEVSEVKPEETKESGVKSSEIKPEITEITTSTVESVKESKHSLKKSKQDNSDETANVTMKTVDDTELTPVGTEKGTDNKQTATLNNSKPMKLHTSKLSKLLTPSAKPKKGKSIKSSSVTIPNKTEIEKIGQESPKKDENLYFIKWLGIKNSDKPLITMIALLIIALIVGVILTMSSK